MKYRIEYWEERVYRCSAVVEADNKEDAEELLANNKILSKTERLIEKTDGETINIERIK